MAWSLSLVLGVCSDGTAAEAGKITIQIKEAGQVHQCTASFSKNVLPKKTKKTKQKKTPNSKQNQTTKQWG